MKKSTRVINDLIMLIFAKGNNEIITEEEVKEKLTFLDKETKKEDTQEIIEFFKESSDAIKSNFSSDIHTAELECYDVIIKTCNETLRKKSEKSSYDNAWLEKYQLLCEFYQEFGHTIVLVDTIYHGTKLGVWLRNQKYRAHKGELSEFRVQKLNELGVIWNLKTEEGILERQKQLKSLGIEEIELDKQTKQQRNVYYSKETSEESNLDAIDLTENENLNEDEAWIDDMLKVDSNSNELVNNTNESQDEASYDEITGQQKKIYYPKETSEESNLDAIDLTENENLNEDEAWIDDMLKVDSNSNELVNNTNESQDEVSYEEITGQQRNVYYSKETSEESNLDAIDLTENENLNEDEAWIDDMLKVDSNSNELVNNTNESQDEVSYEEITELFTGFDYQSYLDDAKKEVSRLRKENEEKIKLIKELKEVNQEIERLSEEGVSLDETLNKLIQNISTGGKQRVK